MTLPIGTGNICAVVHAGGATVIIARGVTIPHTWARVVDLGFAHAEGSIHGSVGKPLGIPFSEVREEYGDDNSHLIVAKLPDVMDHMREHDNHTVAIYYPTDTAGYLSLHKDDDRGYYVDVYDSESLDPGPTEEARCLTCDMNLDYEGLDI